MVEIELYERCWYCKERAPAEGAQVDVPVYKFTKREAQWTGPTKLHYLINSLKVPRCRECASAHDSVESSATERGAFAGITVGAVVGISCQAFVLKKEDGAWVGIGAGLMAAFGIYNVVKTWTESRADGTQLVYGREFPPLQKMLEDGWEVGKP